MAASKNSQSQGEVLALSKGVINNRREKQP